MKLSAVETATLIEAIERRLQRFGIKHPPDLDYVREISETSPENEFRVITAFIIVGHGPTNTGIEVSVMENKRDATAAVLVESRAWPFSKFLADSVIEEVQLALVDTLPDYQVLAERGVGLDLR